MSYLILPPSLHDTANAARSIIESRYGLHKIQIEKQIDKSIPWQPTFYWQNRFGYLAVEVSERPFPIVLSTAYSDIVTSGLPIRIIVAYPKNSTISLADYQRDIAKAKQHCIGYIGIQTDLVGNIEYSGLSLDLQLPKQNFSNLLKALRPLVTQAYEIYVNGDPKHGVQELGQIVEGALKELAIQAKQKGNLKSGGFIPNGAYYPIATLIDDMTKDRILPLPILGKCRGFINDRNSVSHPLNIKEAVKLERRLKSIFSAGLLILEELPLEIKDRGYKFKVS